MRGKFGNWEEALTILFIMIYRSQSQVNAEIRSATESEFPIMNYPAESCGLSDAQPKRVCSKLLGMNP
jgi:hypothetical protein